MIPVNLRYQNKMGDTIVVATYKWINVKAIALDKGTVTLKIMEEEDYRRSRDIDIEVGGVE